MNPSAISNNILSLLGTGASAQQAGPVALNSVQRLERNGFFATLQGSGQVQSFAEQLRTLLPQDLSAELEALPPELLQRLQAVYGDGKVLPQAAEITPMIQAATASMAEAVKALEDASAELDQVVSPEQILAGLLPSSLMPVEQSEDITVKTADGEAVGVKWMQFLQRHSPQAQPQVYQALVNTQAVGTAAADDAADTIGQDQLTADLLRRSLQQETTRQTAERMSLIAERMKAVGEATPQLANEVKSLSQLLAPAIRVMAQHPATAAVSAVDGDMPDSFAGAFAQFGELAGTQRSSGVTPPAMALEPQAKGWDQALGNRVMWMVGHNVQQASLRITPQHLGPIDIQVSMHEDGAQVSFITHNGAVKEALEASIPRLREIFSENNLQLVNVDVGQRDSQSQRSLAQAFADDRGRPAGDTSYGEQKNAETMPGNGQQGGEAVLGRLGLLDDYA